MLSFCFLAVCLCKDKKQSLRTSVWSEDRPLLIWLEGPRHVTSGSFVFAYRVLHKKIWLLWRGTLQAPKQGEGGGELLAATLPRAQCFRHVEDTGVQTSFLLYAGASSSLFPVYHICQMFSRETFIQTASCFLWYPHLPPCLVLDRFEPLYSFGFWGCVFLIDTLLLSSANCLLSTLHVWAAPFTIVSPALLCRNICAFRKKSLG